MSRGYGQGCAGVWAGLRGVYECMGIVFRSQPFGLIHWLRSSTSDYEAPIIKSDADFEKETCVEFLSFPQTRDMFGSTFRLTCIFPLVLELM